MKLNNWYIPRIDELYKVQLLLVNEMEGLRRDMSHYPRLFR